MARCPRCEREVEPLWSRCAWCGESLAARQGAAGDGAGPAEEARKAEESGKAIAAGKKMFVTGVGGELIRVEPGTFVMGSPKGEPDRRDDEIQHRVELTRPYYLGKYAVTQGEWQAVMGTRPWSGGVDVREDAHTPAVCVSWEDARSFCVKLTERDRSTGPLPSGWAYRLPTEAEWEYACRAGTRTAYSFGDDARRLDEYAWFYEIAWDAHLVGTKRANAWGLHDLHGNVWEWCSDWYGEYPKGPVSNPTGAPRGSFRVLRGGSFRNEARHCRSVTRFSGGPGVRVWHVGFRLACSVAP